MMEISFDTRSGDTVVIKRIRSTNSATLSLVTKDKGTISAELFLEERHRLIQALEMFN